MDSLEKWVVVLSILAFAFYYYMVYAEQRSHFSAAIAAIIGTPLTIGFFVAFVEFLTKIGTTS